MNDSRIKTAVAKNITELRKAAGYTQMAFAEKLNYSDKAVSKWERGESLPDIIVLKEIADTFSVSVDYLLSEHETAVSPQEKKMSKNKKLITFGSAISVYVLAAIIYFFTDLFKIEGGNWKIFIYALPVSFLLILIFTLLWGNKKHYVTVISLFVWSVITAVYFFLIKYNPWVIFIVGAPAEITICLFTGISSHKK